MNTIKIKGREFPLKWSNRATVNLMRIGRPSDKNSYMAIADMIWCVIHRSDNITPDDVAEMMLEDPELEKACIDSANTLFAQAAKAIDPSIKDEDLEKLYGERGRDADPLSKSGPSSVSSQASPEVNTTS